MAAMSRHLVLLRFVGHNGLPDPDQPPKAHIVQPAGPVTVTGT